MDDKQTWVNTSNLKNAWLCQYDAVSDAIACREYLLYVKAGLVRFCEYLCLDAVQYTECNASSALLIVEDLSKFNHFSTEV